MKTLIALVAAFVSLPVAAVNKCTGPDGAITFQDAPCSATAKSSETVKTWDSNLSGKSRAGTWDFRQDIDEMTGKKGCLIVSPVTAPQPGHGGEYKFTPVHLVFAARPDGVTFAVRTSTDKDLIHNDVSGMGIKFDNTGFIPLDVKGGQHVVGSSMNESIVEALSTAKEIRLRVRFWPYDRLHDMMPISTAGSSQAMAMAKRCAGLPLDGKK